MILALFSAAFLTLTIRLVHAGGGGAEAYEPVSHREISGPIRVNRSMYIPLMDYLMEDYDKHALPICERGAVTTAELDMWLYQLDELHEPTQTLIVDVWINLDWQDCRLRWNPANFSGITQVTVKAGYLWHPDLIFYQSLHGNYEEALYVFKESTARIRSNGWLQLGAQVVLRSFCKIQIQDFPFDTQKCNITLSCWNKDASIFKLHKKDIRHSADESRGHSFENAGNGEWDVLGFSSAGHIGQYRVGSDEDTVNNFTEVTFTLTLKRRPKYVMVYLVFPCVLLTWLSVFTFMLPVECGEKITLCITVLLSLIVFLLLVAENVPHTSDGIPVLGTMYCSSIILACISVLMTSLVLNLGHKQQEITMPNIFHRMIRHRYTFLCCFNYNEHNTVQWWSWHPSKQRRTEKFESSIEDKDKEAPVNITDHANESISLPVSTKNHWRYLAMLLDRIFMFVYILLAVLNTAYIFIYYYKHK